MDTQPQPKKTLCPACGKPFVCGMAAGLESCWCMEVAVVALPASGESAGCYCPECLDQKIREFRSRPEITRV